MKESLGLALLLLAALILIPLLAMGGGTELLNPFKATSSTTIGGKDNTASSLVADPNADAQAELEAMLAEHASSQAASSSPETSSQAASSDEVESSSEKASTVVKAFKILNLSTGKVETVSRRDYIIGAVACEMPASFNTEALKAQAVAAHTYALRRRQNQQDSPDESLKDADFSADPSKFQGYITEDTARERFGDKFDVYWDKITKACDEVLEKVLIYENQPIVAAYHSMSAGKTEDAKTVWENGAPYLVPVESFGDTLAKNYEAKTELTATEVQSLLKKQYPDIKLSTTKSKWFKIKSRTDSGTITELTAGDASMTGQEARSLFSLRSANFTIAYASSTFTFTTLGYGHGVGMSQYGADYMARQGSTCEEILAHYYPKTVLTDESELGAAE